MNKSKDQKTKKTVKPEVFNLNKEFVKVSNTYDDTNYVYDPVDNSINTEAEMKKKFSAQDNYKLLKSVANQQEKKEFREIERKYKKKNPIEPRTEQSKGQSTTGVPLDVYEFPNFLKPRKAAAPDDTLKKILEERNKPDPDFYKGLGIFLPKKF